MKDKKGFNNPIIIELPILLDRDEEGRITTTSIPTIKEILGKKFVN